MLLKRRSVDVAELEEAPPPNSPVKVEPFNPPFARAAEMEARRKIRMRSRFTSSGKEPRPAVAPQAEPLNPEMYEEELIGEDDSDMEIPLDGEDAGFFDQ